MQKKDPPILVTRPSLPPVEEYEQLVREIFSSHYLTNGGAQHKKLESALKEKLQTPHLRLFTNGHLALECAIQALNLAPGEIITTPFTFLSTTHAIVRCGFTPVFCDVEPEYFTLDTGKDRREDHPEHPRHPARACLRKSLRHGSHRPDCKARHNLPCAV